MSETVLNAKIQKLLDKQEIYELSATYMRGLDRLDADLLSSVYHDDATDHRGFIDGSAKDFVKFAIEILGTHKVNHHMLGQANISIEGDIAFGEVYFNAYHRVIEDDLEKDFWVFGRYIDRYERRDGIWKIAHRSELNDSCMTQAASDFWLRQTPEALRGLHSKDDLSYDRGRLKRL